MDTLNKNITNADYSSFPYGQGQTSGCYIPEQDLWREYAAFLESEFNRRGIQIPQIACDVLRVSAPKRVNRTVYE